MPPVWLNLLVPPDLKNALLERARLEERSVSAVVRRILRAAVNGD
jgi:hypothetical protein